MPRGVYERTEYHGKRVSEGLRESYRKKMSEGENKSKFDSVNSRIDNLDKEELEDKLASLRYEILARIKILGKEFDKLMLLQKERDRVEERLRELGFHTD